MNYSIKFQSLIHRLEKEADQNLKFVGMGNPNSPILLVGKECAIDRNSSRGEGCYQMEQYRNVEQWAYNIQNNISSCDVEDWVNASSFDEGRYNPLYPYKGQFNKPAIRDAEGSSCNGGTSATWCAYQKLIGKIFSEDKSEYIDFHQRSFMTELSAEVMLQSSYSIKTKQSIDVRCGSLLCDPFYRSFPIVIVACGRYIGQYNINLEQVFDQKYIGEDKDNVGWMHIHENCGRLLIHTRHLVMCSDALMDKIATRVRTFLMNPLLKYCIYYDGTDESAASSLMAFYEKCWLWSSIMNESNFLEENVREMLVNDINSDWIDGFCIPRTLVGIFFNRYCHWVGLWKKEEFMDWFENVRKGNIV